MAEEARLLLSEERPSDDGSHFQQFPEKGAPAWSPHPITTQRRKTGRSVPLCALALAMLILLPCLAGGAFYLGARNSYKPLPEPKNLGSCGASPAQARAKGCVFDFILGGWIHPACLDQEMYDRYLEEWKTLNITLYSGPNETEPVGMDYGLEGDWDLIWGVGNFHYLHCSYVMEKNWKVLMHEIKAVPENCVEDEHMWHCLNLNGKPSAEDITSTKRNQIFERAPILDCLVFH
ncbi:hypothetical protein KVR01_012711 [Diaporthe batatas]|uniref:uncharacterized protein n=1 Tax=Diaporthe batatas TaxID=748121 RepID=UPI001D050D1F|nr:uncharacterized protein KVR01_012711 [Diaporthe batatas]KAG8157327.1 hypothetical protein KVR01_012711 [Diaporthe batatas]